VLHKAKETARYGAIYYGSTSPAMQEALDVLSENGVHVDAMRVRGFPFADEINEFIAAHPGVFVIEQNRDAQLKSMLVNEGQIDPKRLISVLHYDGTPITARFIADHISKHIAAHTVVPMKKAAS
jgi:2-oxoglutarate/2-oxoacid ferredoxin oxidoreductase subunit alpha